MTTGRLRAMGVVCLLLGGVQAGVAGYISAYAEAYTAVTGDGDPATPDNDRTELYAPGYLPVTTVLSRSDSSASYNIYGESGFAEYNLFAEVGTLRASSYSRAMAPAGSASGYAYASAQWGDELIVTGAPGVPVEIAARVVLTADALLDGSTTNAYNYLGFSFLLPGVSVPMIIEENVMGGYVYDQLFILSLMPGTYNINQEIRTNTNATARFTDPGHEGVPTNVASMDAGHTAKLYLDLLSSQGGFSLASGADLRTPEAGGEVPEPGSAWLAVAGLAAVFARVIRRNGGRRGLRDGWRFR